MLLRPYDTTVPPQSNEPGLGSYSESAAPPAPSPGEAGNQSHPPIEAFSEYPQDSNQGFPPQDSRPQMPPDADASRGYRRVPPPSPGFQGPQMPGTSVPGAQMSGSSYQPGYPQGFSPASPPVKPRSKAIPILIAVNVVLVLLIGSLGGAGLYFGWFSKHDSPTYSSPSYISSRDAGPQPFGDRYDNQNLAVNNQELREKAQQALGSASGGAVRASETPELFGGSGELSSCLVGELIEFLQNNSGKAAAFASALSLNQNDLEAILKGYTPLILAHDTQVINYGYENGAPVPFPAVLEAGTAVLIDEKGVPRVRCACGNPLTEPDLEEARPSPHEEPWAGYSVDGVVHVEPSGKLETVRYIDVNSWEVKERGLGSGRTGDVQVTLRWDGPSDIDLHVEDPSGTHIYYGRKKSQSGGELDVDMCVGSGGSNCNAVNNVENIFWSAATAPSGTYQAWTKAYSLRESSTSFSMQVFVDGVKVKEISGTFTSTGDKSQVVEFEHY